MCRIWRYALFLESGLQHQSRPISYKCVTKIMHVSLFSLISIWNILNRLSAYMICSVKSVQDVVTCYYSYYCGIWLCFNVCALRYTARFYFISHQRIVFSIFSDIQFYSPSYK
jgi:hypothetical protein